MKHKIKDEPFDPRKYQAYHNSRANRCGHPWEMIQRDLNRPFETELAALINKYNLEMDSGLEDHVIARHLVECLGEYNDSNQGG